jgi:hypothetical protein
LERLRADPALTLRLAGVDPDPWQERLLRSPTREQLACCSRQAGKSRVAGAKILHTALTRPNSLVLLLSKTDRQAREVFSRDVMALFNALGRPVAKSNDMISELHLENGSRVIPLPCREETVRVYSAVTLLVLDEAARIPDILYDAVRPMLITSRGSVLACSTPFGKRGWFYEAWERGGPAWERYRVTALECPRIGAAALERERRRHPEWWVRQEYLCSFEATANSAFDHECVMRMADPGVSPFLGDAERLALEESWNGQASHPRS